MTELSYLWDGIITGDAIEAPYDSAEFNTYIAGIHNANTDTLLVIPGYENDLDANETGGMGISIGSGAAILKNYVYVNTAAVTLNISQTTTDYFRVDYVILQITFNDRKIRLAVVEGVETDDYTLLEYPILTQNNTIWQTALYRIYVYNNTSIDRNFTYDQREFAVTSYTVNKYDNTNLITNSELMNIDSTGVPAYWDYDGASGGASDKLTPMPRGQSVILNGLFVYYKINTVSELVSGEVYTLKGVFKELTGDDSLVWFDLFAGIGGSNSITFPNNNVSFRKLEVNDEVEFTLRVKVPDNSYYMTGFKLRVYSNFGDTAIGQLIFVRGYHPGPFRQISEPALSQNVMTDANWTDTAKSTGTTTIDLTADFGGLVPPQTKAVLLRVRGKDSGSAAGAPYVSILGYAAPYNAEYGRLDLEGVTNDVYRETSCIVPVNQAIYDAQDDTPQFRIDVVATGAGTLDATVEILGLFV